MRGERIGAGRLLFVFYCPFLSDLFVTYVYELLA